MTDPTSLTSNSYGWIGSSGGLWGSAANWMDSTTGTSPARFVPGANNPVTINEPSGTSYEVISGGGSAASLSLSGTVALNGQYASGSLALGTDPGPFGITGLGAVNTGLNFGAGSTLSTGSVSVKNASIAVSGAGAGFTANAAMTLGGLANYNRAGVFRETGSVSITSGASFMAAATVSVIAGSVSVSGIGSTATFGDALTLGDAGEVDVLINYSSSAGTLAVDAGASLTAQGAISLLYGSSASVTGSGSKLTVGGLSGTGQVQIGKDATLALNGTAAAGTTIAFAGSGATLSIGNASTLPYSIAATVTGFAVGDDIAMATNVTSATYVSTGSNIGTLNLLNGTQQVASLTLSGSYAGANFLVSPNTASGSTITLLQSGGGSTSPVSETSDRYVWVGSSGGLWSSAPNWMDSTNGATPSLYVPGSNNAVTITGPSGSTFETVAGGGSAASLGLTGEVSLTDAYKIGGVLTIGSSDVPTGGATTAFTEGSLALAAAGTISAGSINVVDGTLSLADKSSVTSAGPIVVGSGPQGTINVGASATLSTSGSLSFGANSGMHSEGSVTVGGAVLVNGGDLSVSGAGSKLVANGTMTAAGYVGVGAIQPSNTVSAARGALIQLGGLNLIAPVSPYYNTSAPNLGVDATSVIEIGSTGGAAAGAITVDAGKAIAISDKATFNSALVDNGTVTVTTTPTYDGNGTLTENGDISGTGVVQLVKDSRLELNGNAAASNTIAFLDTGATLSIGPTLGTSLPANAARYRVDVTITGFQAGDNIVVAQPVSTATYSAGPGGKTGTLVLSNGSTTVQTLHLAGDFTGKSFVITPTHALGAGISLVNANPPPPASSVDPLFDTKYYLEQNPDVRAARVDPYQHYLTYGWKEGRDPSALFDTNYYLAQNPDVKTAGADPLLHFEQYGWKEGPNPSLMFSDAKYLAANPDVKAARLDPLLHYMSYGRSEGRIAFLPGGTAATDPLVNAAFYDKQLGATLIPEGVAAQQQAAASYHATGWQKGLNPDAFFDTKYYLSHNRDVAAAHLDPLLHYEQYGWHEGRDPSVQFSTHKYLAAYSDVKTVGIDPLLHYVQYGQAEGRIAFGA